MSEETRIGAGRAEIESWAAQQQPNGAENHLPVGVQAEEMVYMVCQCAACGGEQKFAVRAVHNCPARKAMLHQQVGSLIGRAWRWLHSGKAGKPISATQPQTNTPNAA